MKSRKMWKLILFICGFDFVFGFKEKNFINFGGFVCPKEDKALGKCLRDALNDYIPQLAGGLPEYGIPSCEPLLVPSLSVQQSTGPIDVTSSYTDLVVRGPSTTRVESVRVDSKRHEMIAKLHIPELRVKGNYKLSGKLLMLPIEGDGQFSGKYGDIHAMVTIKLGRRHRENASDTVTCEQLDVKFDVGHASVMIDDLFGRDSNLGKAMNNFINENWQEITKELQRPLEDALGDFLKPLADHAFAVLEADEVLM